MQSGNKPHRRREYNDRAAELFFICAPGWLPVALPELLIQS
jgi:hypothetical protein